MKYIFSIIAFIILIPGHVYSDHSYFNKVKKRLMADGYDKKFIDKIYSPEEISFEFDSVVLFFTISEYKLDYGQFLSEKNIINGSLYIQEYESVFNNTEKKFHVPPEVIASILTVETRLGKFTGNKRVLASLSSIAAMDDSRVKKMVKKSIPSRKNRYSHKKFIKRAQSKSSWAYKELKRLIDYSITNKIDPVGINGSYAGATGIPQFMPSNIAPYGRDGNRDGKIDLHNHEDAIASVGNYLKSHGWTKNIKEDIAVSVVLKYNKSRPYAKTVIELAEKIRDLKNGH